MQGVVRTYKRAATIKLRITVRGAPADAAVQVTDVMLQPGNVVSAWIPHVTELPWSAGVAA